MVLWNLLSLSIKEQTQLINSETSLEDVEIFDYEKNNKRYWKGKIFLKQVVEKGILIAQALYFEYQQLFFFTNVISHFVFAFDAFQLNKINKEIKSQQIFFRNLW